MRRLVRIVATLALAACAGEQPATQPRAAAPPGAGARPADPEPADAQRRAEAGALSAAMARRREQGLTALDAARYDEAEQAFTEVLEAHPQNAAVRALLDLAKAAKNRQGPLVDLASRAPVALERPPFEYTLRAAAPTSEPVRTLRLRKTSEKREYNSEQNWISKYGLVKTELDLPQLPRGRPGNVPPNMPLTYGTQKLLRAISPGGHTVLVFGKDAGVAKYLVVVDAAGFLVQIFDFASWLTAPDTPAGTRGQEQAVQWAEARGGVLYVCNAYRSYSKGPSNNAYVSALELSTGKLLWRSQPLVCNARNFAFHAGQLLTAYGSPEEPKWLYALDQTTGKVTSRTPIGAMPDLMATREGKLYLRTNEIEYVFQLE